MLRGKPSSFIIHHSAFITSSSYDFESFGRDLEGHGEFAYQLAVGLDCGLAHAAQARGVDVGDAGRADGRAAADCVREQAQVSEAAVRVDDADLEGVCVETRARSYAETLAVPRRLAPGRVA